jgi:multisubunit Na+/H+ antiporter MnhG subunit
MSEWIWPAVFLVVGVLLVVRPDWYQRVMIRDHSRGWRSHVQPLNTWVQSSEFRIAVRVAGAFFCLLGVIGVLYVMRR